jgi:hypothetical protein
MFFFSFLFVTHINRMNPQRNSGDGDAFARASQYYTTGANAKPRTRTYTVRAGVEIEKRLPSTFFFPSNLFLFSL